MADYISRGASVEKLREAADCANCNGRVGGICNFCTIGNAVRLIKGIPAADVEPVRHGRWVPSKLRDEIERCSKCGKVFRHPSFYGYKFCPSCGAKMDLED